MTPKILKRKGGRVCQVCSHPDIDKIDEDILARLSDPKVAAKYQLHRAAIQNHRTKHLPIKLADTIAALDEKEKAPLALALAKQGERLRFQQDRYDRMRVILEERGEEMAGVAGGRSGMLARTYKQIGSGDTAEVREEYKVDAAFLKEFRELEKQISEELGQYKREHDSGSNSGPKVIVFKPQIGVAFGPRELPVAQVLEHPDGKPQGYLSPASDELPILDAEPEPNPEVVDDVESDGERKGFF